MATEASIEVSAPDNHESEILFRQLEAYPWSIDREFQSGLQSILDQNQSPEQIEHLTLRARCFYYARKSGIPIDFYAYKAWRADRHASCDLTNGTAPLSYSNSSAASAAATSSSAVEWSPTLRHEPTSDPTGPPAPYPTTFSQIMKLISTGQPIPGIKDVPDTVLEGHASRSMAGKRRKPWEKDGGGDGE
ncbi:MAG: hypothetical protein Q9217_002237 [Psora testacea]